MALYLNETMNDFSSLKKKGKNEPSRRETNEHKENWWTITSFFQELQRKIWRDGGKGEKKRKNLARRAETGALPTEMIWGGGQTTSLAVRLLPNGDLFVA